MCGTLLSWTPIIQIAWEILYSCFRQGWRSNTHCVHPSPLLDPAEEANNPLLRLIAIAPTSLWLIKPTSFFLHNNPEQSMGCRGGACDEYWISAGRGKYLDKKNDCWHLRTFRHLVSVMSGQKHKNTNKQTESLIFGCQGSFAFLQRFLFASSWGLAQRQWLHNQLVI